MESVRDVLLVEILGLNRFFVVQSVFLIFTILIWYFRDQPIGGQDNPSVPMGCHPICINRKLTSINFIPLHQFRPIRNAHNIHNFHPGAG